MNVREKTLHRFLALLLCIIMVGVLLPEMTVSALDTPVLVSAQKKSTSVEVKWKPVAGAQKYRVFRQEQGQTNWKKLADVDSTVVSYRDNTAQNGVTYKYTVRCIDNNGNYTSGSDNNGVTVTYWAQWGPKVSATVVNGGIRVTWEATGSRYRLFRKVGSGSWVGIANTTGTSFTDTSVSAGTAYTYIVRCMASDGKTYTSYWKDGPTVVYLSGNFDITTLEPVQDGISIKWSAVSGVSEYYVSRYTGQDWRVIATTSATEYIDKEAYSGDFHLGLESGRNYKYKVVYKIGDKKYYTSEKWVYFCSTPELLEVVADQGVFTLKWKAVQGAPFYRVFRRLSPSDNWVGVGDVTTNSFVDRNVSSGQNYYYTVRCLSSDKKSYISGFNTTGIKANYLGWPTLISTSVEETGIEFKWNCVGGQTTYQVYRKTQNTTWQPYAIVTATGDVGSFTDTSANSGQIYYYTVACSDGLNDTSGYDENGLSCIKLSTPVLKAPELTENGIKVSWYGVDYAEKYRVFRKEASGTVWEGIATLNALEYTDTRVVNSGTYVYTVRCMNAAASQYTSYYDTTGVTKQFYSAPVLAKAEVLGAVPAGSIGIIRVSWNAVQGVSYYNVFRKNDQGKWDRIGYTNTTFLDDVPTVSGKTYTYTVMCADGSENNISSYQSNGVSTYFLAVPELTAAYSYTTGKITIKWNSVDGADGYRVYRKALPNGQWSQVAKINSYTTLIYYDTTNVVSNQEYAYTVRAFHGSYQSGFNSDGRYVMAK